jgi:hypothetical protein
MGEAAMRVLAAVNEALRGREAGMARARLRAGRKIEEIGEVIVAAWFKALPPTSGPIGDIDEYELSAAFSNILDKECVAVLDTSTKIHVAIPYIFDDVKNHKELIEYLHSHYDQSDSGTNMTNPFNCRNRPLRQRKFSEDMGQALFFGCGK